MTRLAGPIPYVAVAMTLMVVGYFFYADANESSAETPPALVIDPLAGAPAAGAGLAASTQAAAREGADRWTARAAMDPDNRTDPNARANRWPGTPAMAPQVAPGIDPTAGFTPNRYPPGRYPGGSHVAPPGQLGAIPSTGYPPTANRPTTRVPSAGQQQSNPPVAGAGLPSPQQQGADFKKFVEGHWHGMELLELTPSLIQVYKLPPGQKGLLVDEVSLESASAGMLAGDVVRSIGGMRISTLQDFQDATYVVRNQRQVDIGLIRKNQPLTVTMRTARALGYAMFEAASPILPGAISPHKNRNRPCTDCHIIMKKGGQLAIDAGDLTPTPPPIVAGAQPPHQSRGTCETCHQIITPPGP